MRLLMGVIWASILILLAASYIQTHRRFMRVFPRVREPKVMSNKIPTEATCKAVAAGLRLLADRVEAGLFVPISMEVAEHRSPPDLILETALREGSKPWIRGMHVEDIEEVYEIRGLRRRAAKE